MSELESGEKNNMKYWLCDQYFNTTDRYDVHIWAAGWQKRPYNKIWKIDRAYFANSI